MKDEEGNWITMGWRGRVGCEGGKKGKQVGGVMKGVVGNER